MLNIMHLIKVLQNIYIAKAHKSVRRNKLIIIVIDFNTFLSIIAKVESQVFGKFKQHYQLNPINIYKNPTQ